ncbi:Uncharacterized protein BP5553_02048 [Venustampulla echinocandica]|uniref:Uncharacterized protein n=1 Tax=Venustampulla echinocandica TaxID=2656787 RepID=A0A370U2R9_9HELO|nr:Uncharacterized protein BP5553_02048 [Venustampulla echinocandica]RDL42069.1 Uncharacterized protein BP5553_02048 [Venustampulla echinocandica]
MPRSAIDATRFTSTTPHATAPGSTLPLKARPTKQPGPKGETPQEKVRRLRAAADRARDANISTFDKLIIRGRVWADRAHRFTALSLIGATFICGGVTVYALGDMMAYNRRKRAEFYAEQKAVYAAGIHDAREAVKSGTATEEQISLITKDNEIAAIQAAKLQKKGVFKKGKEWLFAGLKKAEEGDDVGTSERRLGYEGSNEEDDGLGAHESDIIRAIEVKKMELTAKAKQAFENEKERQRTGGPLDQLGTEATRPSSILANDRAVTYPIVALEHDARAKPWQ